MKPMTMAEASAEVRKARLRDAGEFAVGGEVVDELAGGDDGPGNEAGDGHAGGEDDEGAIEDTG